MKYLNDGRKVVIVGTLNSQETIVQEIFVTESGNEIPSGENFVVKSLHDEPVLSYKEKHLKDIEKKTLEFEFKRDTIASQVKAAMEELKGYKAVVRSTKKLVEILPTHDLEVFSQFVTGTIEYLVFDEYTITPPVKMIDRIIDYSDSYREKYFDSIKLVSVFGKSEGELEYRIHRYSDHSGGFNRVYPFTNRTAALKHIRRIAVEKIEDDRLGSESYRNCISMGITFSVKHKKQYDKKQNKNKLESIKSIKKQIAEKKVDLEKLLKEVTP